MIPAKFDYVAPTSIDDAVRVLAEAGEDAKVLAGGQSLMPVLRLRLAAPSVVVDLGKIAELSGVRDDGDAIVIGAMTTHHDVTRDPLVAEHAALVAKATETVADPQIRHRGTFGGALAHADPAGDVGSTVVAMDGELLIAGPNGRRSVPASEFFVDFFTTALAEGEILLGARLPKLTGWGAHYEKFHRTAQAWSIVAVAAAVRTDGGQISEARVALTNMGPTPVRAFDVERRLVGTSADVESIRAITAEVAEGMSPPSDANADSAFRKHLAGVLTRRAVATAAGVS